MADQDPASVLANAAGGAGNITAYVDQTVTIVSITKSAGKFPGQDVSVKAAILVGDPPEEAEVYVTPTIARQLIAAEDSGLLPLDVTVSSYPSSFGKPGYKVELA